MGPDASQEQIPQAKILEVKSRDRNKQALVSEYEGIPLVDPLIERTLLTEKYPDDIFLSPGKLPEAQAILKKYFSSITYHLNKNEQILAQNIKRQLDEYSSLDTALEKRRVELDKKLSDMLSLFRSLHDDVKESTEKLNNVIERADRLAALLDSSLPTFENYKNQ